MKAKLRGTLTVRAKVMSRSGWMGDRSPSPNWTRARTAKYTPNAASPQRSRCRNSQAKAAATERTALGFRLGGGVDPDVGEEELVESGLALARDLRVALQGGQLPAEDDPA